MKIWFALMDSFAKYRRSHKIELMKTAPKYLSILGLAIALTPSLQLRAEEANQTAPKGESRASSLDATFAAISETIQTARNQASVAVAERDKALSELADSRKQQKETAAKLQEALKQQAETAKQLAGTRKELAESKSAQEKSRKEAESLAKQLEVGDEAYAKLVAFRTQMQESLKNLNGIDESIAKFRAELASPTSAGQLQEEIAKLKSGNDDLSKQIAGSKTALKKERDEREAASKEAADAKKQIVAMREQSADAESKGRQMTTRVSELEKAHAQTLTDLKSTREELSRTREDAAKTAAEMRKIESGNASALAEAKKEIAELKEARKSAEQAAGNASAELKSARKSGEELKNALQDSRKKVGELESRMKEVSKNASDGQDGKAKGDS